MYCLTSTPDDVLERHMETVKEYYSSRKVRRLFGGVASGLAGLCYQPGPMYIAESRKEEGN